MTRTINLEFLILTCGKTIFSLVKKILIERSVKDLASDFEDVKEKGR